MKWTCLLLAFFNLLLAAFVIVLAATASPLVPFWLVALDYFLGVVNIGCFCLNIVTFFRALDAGL